MRALAMGRLAVFAASGPARWVLRDAWESLRRGILNQDVLAAVAVLAGIAGGVAGLFFPAFPAGEFFGAAVFVLAFHVVGRYLSVLVHVRASQSVRRLLSLAPRTARTVPRKKSPQRRCNPVTWCTCGPANGFPRTGWWWRAVPRWTKACSRESPSPWTSCPGTS